MSILMKKYFFAIIIVLTLSLFVFIKTTKAADPPLGCSCPGPGGTCVGGPSYWVSPTQYQGYYYCSMSGGFFPCPGPIRGWKQILQTGELLEDSHGCDSPGCISHNCAVGGILWEKIPAPTCTLTANPPSLGGGVTTSTLSWTTTNIDLSMDSAIISNNIDATIITATATPGDATVSPIIDTVYTMTVNNSETATYSATITILSASCTITADPSGVFALGETSRISWTIENATGGAINGVALTPAEVAAKSGSFITPPITGSTVYNMTVAGTINGSCAVTIDLLSPPTGGLIPCGRLVNSPPAAGEPDLIDESKPCNLCALFFLLKNIINFVTTLAIGIGVFILVIAGLLYATSVGNPKNIELAKSAVSSTLIGLAIIFIAWLVIAVILQGMGYSGMGTWSQVNCMI